MNKKGLSLLFTVALLAMLIARTGWADIPAPPTNQQVGIDDGIFNNLTEAECRLCHDDPSIVGEPSNVDRHHLLYEEPIPQGACSVNRNTCSSDEECDPGICSNTVPAVSCTIDDTCPSFSLGEFCGEVCIGNSVVPNPDADNDGIPDSTYGCLSCHQQSTVGGVIQFLVERDCLQCHIQVAGEGSVHHLTNPAQVGPIGDPTVGDCTPCHGTLVDDIGDGHTIPIYDPSLVTPEPSTGACSDDPSTACYDDGDCVAGTCDAVPGGCNYCHDAGTDTDTGVEVFTNNSTHHNTGVFLSETGVVSDSVCLWCHDFTPPFEDPIRTCEGCHGLESLHNIQVDSDTGCVYDPSDPAACNIIVGGELAGYGHVGRDAGPDDSDCWGCHGFSSASAPGSGPITPSITSPNALAMTAGTDTSFTLTGVAFINFFGTTSFLSEVVLTASDGSQVTLAPDSITPVSLTVTIPGTTPPGNYKLQAVKGDSVASNPVVVSIKPEVVVTAVDFNNKNGTLTITGASFGDAPPEGAGEYINVELGGALADIISWGDDEITVSASSYDGLVTVNALFGADIYKSSLAEMCDCLGDFDADSDVDGTDTYNFKTQWGKENCGAQDACYNHDYDCDGDVDGTDVFRIKTNFGREGCPSCGFMCLY